MTANDSMIIHGVASNKIRFHVHQNSNATICSSAKLTRDFDRKNYFEKSTSCQLVNFWDTLVHTKNIFAFCMKEILR